MTTSIDLADAGSLLRVEPHRRFVCLVALQAAHAGVEQVLFRREVGGWAILKRQGEAWAEFLTPVDGAAAVGRTLRGLIRPSGLLGRLGLGVRHRGFRLVLGDGSALTCSVGRDGRDWLLSVATQGFTGYQPGELLRSYADLRGHEPATAP